MMRILVLVAIVWLLPVCLGSMNLDVGAAFSEEKAAKKKTRKVPAMREKTYKTISEAQVFIEDNQAAEALPILLSLQKRRSLNRYEVAQIWNMLAFAYYTLEDIPKTIDAYKQVIGQGEVTLALELGTLRSLFQLYYQQEKYRLSIDYMNRWTKVNEGPDVNVLYLKATAQYQIDEFRAALKTALELEQLAVAMQKTIKENWYYLQVILFNELEDYDNVINVLEKLIVHYPKKQYWMHLAGMYAEKELDEKALSAYYATYSQGLLTRESEVVMLAQRLLNAEVPFEAGSILERGMDSTLIEKNEKNLRLLAQSWSMSQDMGKAIESWRAASKFSEDGQTYYRLGIALANEDRHKEAVKAYEDALDGGDLNNPRDVSFWMGISLMQLTRWDNATSAFRDAAKDKRKAKACRNYIRYISGEKRRERELKKMLAD